MSPLPFLIPTTVPSGRAITAPQSALEVITGIRKIVNEQFTAGGARLWKKTDGQITGLWIGSLYEEKDGKVLCHVYAGGRLVATFEPEGGFACLLENNRYLAALWHCGDRTLAVFFGDGCPPLSGMALAILAGLFVGRASSHDVRRRARLALASRGHLGLALSASGAVPRGTKAGCPRHQEQGQDALATILPLWRRVVLLCLAASVFLSSNPQAVYAGTPDYDPVFYYYHPDHLGSSQLMTDRDGDVVQHYGYSPFGRENYRNNTYAFRVSNRYTGQQLDEDTGLYYYGARYHDPELARFIQADSTIPDPEFSQAYNRYAYVYNNPLKFSDPLGQFPMIPALAILADFFTETLVGQIVFGTMLGATVSCIAGANPTEAFLSSLFASVGGTLGGVAGATAGGALGAAVTGGDPLKGGICAGIAAGVQVALGLNPMPSAAELTWGKFVEQLALSTFAGAFAGGVTAEMSGADFGQGAIYGAAGGAAGYTLTAIMIKYADHPINIKPHTIVADAGPYHDLIDAEADDFTVAETMANFGIAFLEGMGRGAQGVANVFTGGLIWEKHGVFYEHFNRQWEAAGLDSNRGDINFRSGQRAGRIGEACLLAAGILRLFRVRGPEYSQWKHRGEWNEGYHFHAGRHPSLQKHHLPQEFGDWWKNYRNLK